MDLQNFGITKLAKSAITTPIPRFQVRAEAYVDGVKVQDFLQPGREISFPECLATLTDAELDEFNELAARFLLEKKAV